MPASRVGPLLLRLPNWLGDLVLAWPVVEAAAREGADFAGPAAFESLVAPRVPGSRYLGLDRNRRGEAVRLLRSARPRAALLLTDSLSSAWIAWLAGIPCRIGFAAELRGLFLTHRVPRIAPARTVPRASEYRAIAEAGGLSGVVGEPKLEPLDWERSAGRESLEGRGVVGRYLVLAPGAAYGPAKQWGVDRFVDVGMRIAGRRGLPVVLVGTEVDRAITRAVGHRLLAGGVPAHDLAGATTLGALVGILASAEGVLSNDSGVMHLAAALGRPTVAVFGSTSPIWTAARSPWVESLFAAYPCSPCYRRTCVIGYGCLRAVKAGAAASAYESLMSRGTSRSTVGIAGEAPGTGSTARG